MAELIQIDPRNYNIDDFDIDPATVTIHKFIDSKDNTEKKYFTGKLTYQGQFPFFVVEGDSYGVQKANKNKDSADDDDSAPAMPQMVMLPSATAAAPKKPAGKEKWQVSVKLSAMPAEKDWTADEKVVIDFIDNGMRRIIARILTKRPEILTKIGSNAISDARAQLQMEMNTPEMASKYADQASQLARLRVILEGNLFGKVARKVYRKKKKTGAPESSHQPENLLSGADEYDETSSPAIYASIINYISKQTNTEEFGTRYYKFVQDEPEEMWPSLTHQEAVALGWYRVKTAIRFDDTYFGASIAPQTKAAEVIMLKSISGTFGHKGRLIKAPEGVKREPRLITRVAIQPTSGAAEPKMATIPEPMQAPSPQPFDMSSLAGIPGIGELPPPTITQ